jgi:hypothetical protein
MQKAQDPIRKISKAKKWVRVLGIMVDLAHEALSSNPSTTKKKRKRKMICAPWIQQCFYFSHQYLKIYSNSLKLPKRFQNFIIF